MKNIVKVLLLMVFIHHVNAQNPGYFGKKNVVDFSINVQNPMFSNLRARWNDNVKFWGLNGSNLSPKNDRIDWGFRFDYSRTLKRNFAIGIEFGYDYFSVQRHYRRDLNSNYNYYFESINASSMCIMPKLEFSSPGGLLPMGISHQIGFGVRVVKPVEKAYQVAMIEGYQTSNNPNTILPINPGLSSYLPYNGSSIKGYTFMYALNFRSPLTKSLMLNYGIRYTLNIMGKAPYDDYSVNSWSDLQLTENEFREIARYRKQFSLIQASIGLSFAF